MKSACNSRLLKMFHNVQGKVWRRSLFSSCLTIDASVFLLLVSKRIPAITTPQLIRTLFASIGCQFLGDFSSPWLTCRTCYTNVKSRGVCSHGLECEWWQINEKVPVNSEGCRCDIFGTFSWWSNTPRSCTAHAYPEMWEKSNIIYTFFSPLDK